MIGTHPVAALAPLDYRYALDAAMPALTTGGVAPLVLCNVWQLAGEVEQRIPIPGKIGMASAALWLEPLADSWETDLEGLADALPQHGLLVVIASLPLARTLPERRAFGVLPLGLQGGGMGRLRRGLAQSGFALEARYGMHSSMAIGLNLLGRALVRAGRPNLGDQLHYAARLHYCTTGPLAAYATVALLMARKVHS
jgi:hypothetical protein